MYFFSKLSLTLQRIHERYMKLAEISTMELLNMDALL